MNQSMPGHNATKQFNFQEILNLNKILRVEGHNQNTNLSSSGKSGNIADVLRRGECKGLV